MSHTAHTRRHGVHWDTALQLRETERAAFAAKRPRSRALSAAGSEHLLFGVPLHWMDDWSTPFALYIASAQGASIRDVDGFDYTDFCLGDTGAMFGHAPAPVAQALRAQCERGFTAMLPSPDAPWVAAELSRRFGMDKWQFALSASDANRFAIRWARAITGRDKILVFNGCYHGTVDDVFVDLEHGQPVQRASLLGQVYPLTKHTRVVEFNDLAALEAALAEGDVACVLAEPVLTNIGMVLPQDGYWPAAQALIRDAGALLLIDETHTISSGPGGYARDNGMAPDMLVLGKPVAGGIPCAVYGFSADTARRAEAAKRAAPAGHSGIGTTLSANMLTLAAMRANLAEVMTDDAYRTMFGLAAELAAGLRAAIARHGLPWCVTQVGARTEFQFCPTPPGNGTEAAAILDSELEQIVHLYLLNRGLMITPFHNMLLVCPDTRPADIARLIAVFDQLLAQLKG